MKKSYWFILAILLSLAACAPTSPVASQNGIEIYDARILLPGGDAMKDMPTSLAGFLVIKNTAKSGDRLTGVSADFADASLHETKISNDIVTMDEIQGVDIPAGQMVELVTTSYHIMLVNVTREIKVGDKVTLILEFQNAGKLVVDAVVTEK